MDEKDGTKVLIGKEDKLMLQTLAKAGQRSMRQTVSVIIKDAFKRADLELTDA